MKVQDTGEARSYALITALNALIRTLTDDETTYPHYDVTGTTNNADFRNLTVSPFLVTLSSTATLAAVKAMANEARTVLLAHFLDANAHAEADTTNAALIDTDALDDLVTADSQGTTDTFIEALVTAYEAHRTQSGVHSHNDSTNVIVTTAAIDLASSKLRVADIKTQANAHIQLAWPTPSIELV